MDNNSGSSEQLDALTTLHTYINSTVSSPPLSPSFLPLPSTQTPTKYFFFWNISHLSESLQFALLCGGLVVSLCVFGYYQELVSYNWFHRELALFVTFIHFFGCTIIAQSQRCARSHSDLYKDIKLLGNAPLSTAVGYHALLVFIKVFSGMFSNLSMTKISYPVKVICKSANPIVILAVGAIWFRKVYPMKDYICVALLATGLYEFIFGIDGIPLLTNSEETEKVVTQTTSSAVYQHEQSDELDTGASLFAGLAFISASMVLGAILPLVQEHCIERYHAPTEDLLYYNYIGCTIVVFLMALVNGEMFTGVQFILATGNFYYIFALVTFIASGYYGANFSIDITSHYGSLVTGISNTFRKALTLTLSYLLFPERNVFSVVKLIGVVIFFGGLLIKLLFPSDSYASFQSISNRILSGSKPMRNKRSLSSLKIFNSQSIEDFSVLHMEQEEQECLIPRNIEPDSDMTIITDSRSRRVSFSDQTAVDRLNESAPEAVTPVAESNSEEP